jgi:uncharacterized protein YdeI (YjbR/CyaY-like superfamily)
MRARNPMPDDILELLKSENVIEDYFARPSYQQNDYLGWISRAARAETRQKRINQMISELREGGVYMKMSHPASSKK